MDLNLLFTDSFELARGIPGLRGADFENAALEILVAFSLLHFEFSRINRCKGLCIDIVCLH